MKTLILLITIIAATSLVWAEENEEIIWETEQIGGINDVLVSPLGEIFYNVTGSTIQIRSIEDGTLIDFFIPEDMPNHITDISITDDGKYMAMSGDNPHIVIYDLQEQKEVKRLTTAVWEEEKFGENKVYLAERWVNSSISPDGTKVTGIAINEFGVKKSSLSVIDIVTEDILFESRRQLYDIDIPKPDNYEWISSEFSPDGKFIVAQLDFDYYQGNESDSIYIHDANTFEVYDVVHNSYNTTTSEIVFSKFESIFCVPDKKNITLYKLDKKYADTLYFQKPPRNIVFSSLDRNLLIRIGIESPTVYDYENKKLKQQIDYVGVPQITTPDNKVIYRPGHYFGLVLVEFDWKTVTNVSQEDDEISQLSPNPTTGNINIQLNNLLSSEFHYELINVSGQIIKSSTLGFVSQNGQSSIDISDVPNGSYTIRVYSNREDFTFNIIKEG